MSAPLKLLFVWRGLGPYHVARMKALAARPDVDLRVVARHEAEPGRAWPTEDGAHRDGLRCFTWEQAVGRRDPAPDFTDLDAIVMPGWYEMELMALMRRVSPSALRLVYSVSNAHDRTRLRWREWIKRGRLAAFDGALTGGRASAAYARDLGMPAERIAEVGNVADPTPFVAARAAFLAAGSVHGPGPDTRPILYVGRLSREKNVAALVDAFVRCAEQAASTGRDLLLVGEGPERGAIEARIPTVLRTRIRLLGALAPAEVAAHMARCAFLALPSTTEPWGLVVNEAMHAGRPVLMTPACGCLAELGRPGVCWMAGGEDVASLEEALRRAIADAPHHDTMGARAADLVAAHTPDTFAGRVVAALARLRSLGPRRR